MSLYVHGTTYTLTLKSHAKKRVKLIFEEGAFTLFYHHYDEVLFHRAIDRFYKEKITQELPLLLEHWSSSMGLEYNKVSYRKSKRQWGSCSGKNNLSFNTMMMKLPQDVIQYIVVHELAHIKHKHHQKSFWSLVETHLPDYKAQVAILKHYTTH